MRGYRISFIVLVLLISLFFIFSFAVGADTSPSGFVAIEYSPVTNTIMSKAEISYEWIDSIWVGGNFSVVLSDPIGEGFNGYGLFVEHALRADPNLTIRLTGVVNDLVLEMPNDYLLRVKYGF